MAMLCNATLVRREKMVRRSSKSTHDKQSIWLASLNKAVVILTGLAVPAVYSFDQHWRLLFILSLSEIGYNCYLASTVVCHLVVPVLDCTITNHCFPQHAIVFLYAFNSVCECKSLVYSLLTLIWKSASGDI